MFFFFMKTLDFTTEVTLPVAHSGTSRVYGHGHLQRCFVLFNENVATNLIGHICSHISEM